MRIAACAFRPEWVADPAALALHMRESVAQAVRDGAQVLLFPEYAGCSAALIGHPEGMPGADVWAARMADGAEVWRDLHGELAQAFGVWIVAGSLAVRGPGGLVNRAYVVGPQGQVSWQDKMILTPYERDVMGLVPGEDLRVFETPLGRMGVLICYDSEFPLLARALVEQGVDMILVPSATDYPAGQTRVRQSCRARAIEGQCLVVQAPVLGGVPGCDVLDVGTGRAAVFCPPDYGLPEDGILAQGAVDVPGWVVVDVDLGAITAPRLSGQVGNVSHWPEQVRGVKSVTQVDLRG